MKHACLLSAVLMLTPASGHGGGKDEVKSFDGTWLPATAELAGQQFPDEVLKTMKVVLKAGKYVVSHSGRSTS